MNPEAITRFAAVTRVFVEQVGEARSPTEAEFEAGYLYIVDGLTPTEIARQQGVAKKTVETHLTRFRQKCGLDAKSGSFAWFPMRCAYWRAVGFDAAAAEQVPVAVASTYWRAVGLVEAQAVAS